MKKTLRIFATCLALSCFTLIPSCGDDAGPDPGDPTDFCNLEICQGDSDAAKLAKQVCIDEYNSCVAGGGNKEDCAKFAKETCTI